MRICRDFISTPRATRQHFLAAQEMAPLFIYESARTRFASAVFCLIVRAAVISMMVCHNALSARLFERHATRRVVMPMPPHAQRMRALYGVSCEVKLSESAATLASVSSAIFAALRCRGSSDAAPALLCYATHARSFMVLPDFLRCAARVHRRAARSRQSEARYAAARCCTRSAVASRCAAAVRDSERADVATYADYLRSPTFIFECWRREMEDDAAAMQRTSASAREAPVSAAMMRRVAAPLFCCARCRIE